MMALISRMAGKFGPLFSRPGAGAGGGASAVARSWVARRAGTWGTGTRAELTLRLLTGRQLTELPNTSAIAIELCYLSSTPVGTSAQLKCTRLTITERNETELARFPPPNLGFWQLRASACGRCRYRYARTCAPVPVPVQGAGNRGLTLCPRPDAMDGRSSCALSDSSKQGQRSPCPNTQRATRCSMCV